MRSLSGQCSGSGREPVGELNQGWTVAKALLADERIANGAPILPRQSFEVLEELVEAVDLLADLGETDRCAQLFCDIEDLAALHSQVAFGGLVHC